MASDRVRLRTALTMGTGLVSVGLGLWQGEDVSVVLAWQMGAWMLGAAALAWFLAPPQVSSAKGVGVALCLLGFAAGFVSGRYSATSAFYVVTVHGEKVREALSSYHEAQGHYPDTLEALGIELPGQTLTRGGLLRYAREGEGYRLSAATWQHQVEASASKGFPL